MQACGKDEAKKMGLTRKTIEKPVIPVEQKRPPVNKRVILVSGGFRCLGYVDRQAVWRDARDQEVKDVIGWFEI